MALTQCRECGKQVSTRATACPHCGAKQAAESHGVVLSEKRKSRIPIIVLIGMVAFLVLVSTLGIPKSDKPVKSKLEVLCDELSEKEYKFRTYMQDGKVDYAVDMTRDIEEIHGKMLAYKPQECKSDLAIRLASESTASKSAASGQANPVSGPAPTKGCNAPPFEVLPLGKPLTIPEFQTLLTRSCQVSFNNADRPLEIQWQDKTYRVDFVKSPLTDGIARYEVKSIRAQ